MSRVQCPKSTVRKTKGRPGPRALTLDIGSWTLDFVSFFFRRDVERELQLILEFNSAGRSGKRLDPKISLLQRKHSLRTETFYAHRDLRCNPKVFLSRAMKCQITDHPCPIPTFRQLGYRNIRTNKNNLRVLRDLEDLLAHRLLHLDPILFFDLST